MEGPTFRGHESQRQKVQEVEIVPHPHHKTPGGREKKLSTTLKEKIGRLFPTSPSVQKKEAERRKSFYSQPYKNTGKNPKTILRERKAAVLL